MMGQDARFYYEDTNYDGPYKDLKPGQTVSVNADAISIKKFNPKVSIKATHVDDNWNEYNL